MDNAVNFNQVEERVIKLRGIRIIIDSDVAILYGVTTKEVNQAVKNNLDKFSNSYILETTKEEKSELIKKFDRFNALMHSSACPKAFTEKGFYMLAAILKSEKATQTAIAIVEIFTKVRELTRTLSELSNANDDFKQKSLMEQSSEILADLLGNDPTISDPETTIGHDSTIHNANMPLNEKINNEKEWSEEIGLFPVLTYFAGVCKN